MYQSETPHPANPPPMVRLADVTKRYGDEPTAVTALRGVSLDLYPGEVVVVLGPSGAGKSTLLHIIGGIDTATAGQALVQEQDLTGLGDTELTAYRRRRVGFIFQAYNLISGLTALENVMLAAEVAAQPLDPAQVLTRVGLGERMHHFPAQLSGGEQQRVAIARAVAKRPDLLLCDEPTGALDAPTGKAVLALLQELSRETGCTVVIITHNSVIARMADRVVTMASGRIEQISHNPDPADPADLEW